MLQQWLTVRVSGTANRDCSQAGGSPRREAAASHADTWAGDCGYPPSKSIATLVITTGFWGFPRELSLGQLPRRVAPRVRNRQRPGDIADVLGLLISVLPMEVAEREISCP